MPPARGAYFDSALVAKYYVNEPGRDAVRQLAVRARKVVTSGIARAEVSAAFHRKLREKAIDSDVFKALQGQFDHDVDAGVWKLVGPTDALLEDVQRLFRTLDEAVFLRSIDALHLVSARSEGFTRLYTNDRHLLGACAALGIEGINPL